MESPAHFNAKCRVIQLIKDNYPHYEISDPVVEYQIWRVIDGGFLMKWKLDVHAIYHSCTKCGMFWDRIAVESDTPGVNHGTRIKINRDEFRDRFLAESDGIRTVRLNTFYIWPSNRATLEKARKNMPDELILKEMALLPPKKRACSIKRQNIKFI